MERSDLPTEQPCVDQISYVRHALCLRHRFLTWRTPPAQGVPATDAALARADHPTTSTTAGHHEAGERKAVERAACLRSARHRLYRPGVDTTDSSWCVAPRTCGEDDSRGQTEQHPLGRRVGRVARTLRRGRNAARGP